MSITRFWKSRGNYSSCSARHSASKTRPHRWTDVEWRIYTTINRCSSTPVQLVAVACQNVPQPPLKIQWGKLSCGQTACLTNENRVKAVPTIASVLAWRCYEQPSRPRAGSEPHCVSEQK